MSQKVTLFVSQILIWLTSLRSKLSTRVVAVSDPLKRVRRMGLRRRLRRTSSVSSDDLCVSVQGQRDDKVKIAYAKRKKSDPKIVILVQVVIILILASFVYLCLLLF